MPWLTSYFLELFIWHHECPQFTMFCAVYQLCSAKRHAGTCCLTVCEVNKNDDGIVVADGTQLFFAYYSSGQLVFIHNSSTKKRCFPAADLCTEDTIFLHHNPTTSTNILRTLLFVNKIMSESDACQKAFNELSVHCKVPFPMVTHHIKWSDAFSDFHNGGQVLEMILKTLNTDKWEPVFVHHERKGQGVFIQWPIFSNLKHRVVNYRVTETYLLYLNGSSFPSFRHIHVLPAETCCCLNKHYTFSI